MPLTETASSPSQAKLATTYRPLTPTGQPLDPDAYVEAEGDVLGTPSSWRHLKEVPRATQSRDTSPGSTDIKVSPEDKVQVWWWACSSNVMIGQTLVPFKMEFQVFTDASKEG